MQEVRHLVLIPAPRAMPAFFPVLSILNQKQPREMGKGNHDLSLSTCVPAVCAAWCCVLLLLQQQSSGTEGVTPPAHVSFLPPSDPCAGV